MTLTVTYAGKNLGKITYCDKCGTGYDPDEHKCCPNCNHEEEEATT